MSTRAAGKRNTRELQEALGPEGDDAWFRCPIQGCPIPHSVNSGEDTNSHRKLRAEHLWRHGEEVRVETKLVKEVRKEVRSYPWKTGRMWPETIDMVETETKKDMVEAAKKRRKM